MTPLPTYLRTLVALMVIPWRLGALTVQDPEAFSPAALDSLEAAAEAAPLFASHEPLPITLSTRVEFLRDERPDEEEVDGMVTWTAAGTRDSVDVEVRTRGNFRREKRNCNFPPLRLDFPRSRVEGTVFEGQDKLKLVAPCQDDREAYQQYVIQEYLAYRLYNLITPVSYRVRLVEITFHDTDGEYGTRTRTGFLIEDDEAMAHRNRAFLVEFEQWHPLAMEADQSTLMALFHYMIGNTDWSQVYFHNTDMVRSWDGRFLPVPYDFDSSGIVNADYAEPNETLGLRTVRERVYRGFCYVGVDHAAQRRRFQELRPTVWDLYQEAPLNENQRQEALSYLEDFYRTLDDFRRYSRLIFQACVPIPDP